MVKIGELINTDWKMSNPVALARHKQNENK